MNQIVNIILPVFGLIGIGYGVAWSRLLDQKTGEALADFVFAVAIPVLIFRTIVAADFGAVSPWRLWLPFFTAYGLVWAAGHLVVRRFFGRDHRASMVGGISAAFGNTVLVGIPLTLAAYGEAGTVAIALIIAVHLPIGMAASAVLIVHAERLDGISAEAIDKWRVARSVGRNLATNPIVIGIFAGLLWRWTGFSLDGVHGVLITRISDVAATVALLALGMSLRKYGMHRNIPAGLAISGLKLLLMPLLVLLLVRYVVALPPVWAKVAVLAAACPTGVNAYLVANRFRTGEALASNAIAISTGLAVVSATFWLHVLDWLEF
jgi:malonate transporter and related proteins